MPTIRNVSPYGALDVPLLRRIVAAGETTEVTDEQATMLGVPNEHWDTVSTHQEQVEDVPATDTPTEEVVA